MTTKTTPRIPPATTPPLPSWQASPCPSWCTWSPHDESEHPADRRHAGTTLKRSLSQEAPCEVEKGVYEPEYVGMYLWQHVREVEPLIQMCKGESREGFALTLEDAEVVAAVLTSLVEEARGRRA